MAFPAPAALHHERNLFQTLFQLMSRQLMDPQTKSLAFFAKMNFKNEIFIYADTTKQRLLLRGVHPVTKQRIGFEAMNNMYAWDIFDSENGDKPLGRFRANLMQSIATLGMESWAITDPEEKPFLTFKADASETLGKRILDNMSNLYNPTHQYHLVGANEKPVAHLMMKHGLFKFYYDLVFEPKVTDTERKMAVALFAVTTLLLKK